MQSDWLYEKPKADKTFHTRHMGEMHCSNNQSGEQVTYAIRLELCEKGRAKGTVAGRRGKDNIAT